MAEVLGIITGAAAVIEQSISLFETIRKAVDSYKDLPDVIERYTKELNRVRELVGLISTEEALQTLAVGAAAENVQDAGEKLKARLKLMRTHSEARKMEKVMRAILSGPDHESKIDKIMKELVEAKIGLIANVVVVNVGLSQGINKTLQVNTATLTRVNDLIHEKLGGDAKSLKLAERVKGRAVDDKGLVDLTSDDIKFLVENKPIVDISASAALYPKVESLRARKVIKGNLSADSAWMQNVPVTEVDDWKDCDLFIIGNTAEGNSVMMNHPVPTAVLLEMFRMYHPNSIL
ncbi:hypothetical protein S7711_02980 [Stachybotrys chartarum IBT 7711]|uniref:Fungal N-terminal domain-containing protein n=1 Tax=Stachybotrys chartarum (strain CBS 109288 / IBT 7711) TaxID=1280523 RepID=A0A084B2H7_STACB|nr:hypothetical protein S7711_02980 [Stachybotrys chartarum IBT 7711]KFA55983.1 hypothetical protein S40293_04047 [Stachybotrys chartarum IBT 40293]